MSNNNHLQSLLASAAQNGTISLATSSLLTGNLGAVVVAASRSRSARAGTGLLHTSVLHEEREAVVRLGAVAKGALLARGIRRSLGGRGAGTLRPACGVLRNAQTIRLQGMIAGVLADHDLVGVEHVGVGPERRAVLRDLAVTAHGRDPLARRLEHAPEIGRASLRLALTEAREELIRSDEAARRDDALTDAPAGRGCAIDGGAGIAAVAFTPEIERRAARSAACHER